MAKNNNSKHAVVDAEVDTRREANQKPMPVIDDPSMQPPQQSSAVENSDKVDKPEFTGNEFIEQEVTNFIEISTDVTAPEDYYDAIPECAADAVDATTPWLSNLNSRIFDSAIPTPDEVEDSDTKLQEDNMSDKLKKVGGEKIIHADYLMTTKFKAVSKSIFDGAAKADLSLKKALKDVRSFKDERMNAFFSEFTGKSIAAVVFQLDHVEYGEAKRQYRLHYVMFGEYEWTEDLDRIWQALRRNQYQYGPNAAYISKPDDKSPTINAYLLDWDAALKMLK